MTNDDSPSRSLALLEVSNLAPAFIVADQCIKSADVELLGVESTDGAVQCIKVVGDTSAVTHAVNSGRELAERMGSFAAIVVLPAPIDDARRAADPEPVYNPILGGYDYRKPRDGAMSNTAIGLLETQGLVAALHATDAMLKASNVEYAGKEKIGAAYVTIFIRGDVAAVQTAIETGQQAVADLGGTLIMSDVIARPHPELAALLP